MRPITRDNLKQWRIHAAYLSAIFCVTVATWFVTDTLAGLREMEHRSRVRSIKFLLENYVQHRSRNGEWPEAKDLYDAIFSLKSSVESADTRVDTFYAESPEQWLQFQLKENGEIAFDVSWAPLETN